MKDANIDAILVSVQNAAGFGAPEIKVFLGPLKVPSMFLPAGYCRLAAQKPH